MMMLFRFRLKIAEIIAKLVVFKQGLKINCLLTRYPIVWVNPDFKECIQLACLREHGYQISAALHYRPSPNTKEHVLTRANRRIPFNQLLEHVIKLAEKDLLEI